MLDNALMMEIGCDGELPSADRILNWSTYCATTNNRNQCSKETCTIFPICKIKEVRE